MHISATFPIFVWSVSKGKAYAPLTSGTGSKKTAEAIPPTSNVPRIRSCPRGLLQLLDSSQLPPPAPSFLQPFDLIRQPAPDLLMPRDSVDPLYFDLGHLHPPPPYFPAFSAGRSGRHIAEIVFWDQDLSHTCSSIHLRKEAAGVPRARSLAPSP